MLITSISPSAYNTYDGCPMQYYLSYNVKLRGPANKAADIGSCTHFILELIAQAKKNFQQDKFVVENKEYGNIYYKDMESLDTNYIINNVYDKWSKKSEFSYDDKKDLPLITKMVNRVLDSDEDPRKLKVISTEDFFSLPIEEPWAKLEDGSYFKINGIIDLVTEDDDKTIVAHDYKSGRYVDFLTGEDYTYAKLSKNIQLHIYHYCMRRLYPQYDNYLCDINFIKNKGPHLYAFTKKDYAETENKLKARFREIRDVAIPVQKKSWKCKKFCYFSQYKTKDAPREFRNGQLDKRDEKMCICSEAHLLIMKKGIETATEELKQKVKDGESK